MGHAVDADHLSDDELAVAGDRDLEPARRARIGAHLAACPDCRRQLVATRQPSRLLQARYPAVPNRGAWEAFADRVPDSERRRASAFNPIPAAGLLALLLLIVVGAVRLRQSMGGDDLQEPLRHVAPSRSGLGPLPFPPVEPPRLPLALVRVERSTPAADHLELLYRNDVGLAILLTQSPIGGTGPPEAPEGPAGQTVVAVGDAPVLVLNDPRPGAVAGLLWDRRGVRFVLLVTETPAEGLPQADAVRIVEALMVTQNAPTDQTGGQAGSTDRSIGGEPSRW